MLCSLPNFAPQTLLRQKNSRLRQSPCGRKAQWSCQPGKAGETKWQLKETHKWGQWNLTVMKEATKLLPTFNSISTREWLVPKTQLCAAFDSRCQSQKPFVQLCSGNLSAEFTQDLDKVALPACSAVDLSVFCPCQFGSSTRTPFDFETSDALRNFSSCSRAGTLLLSLIYAFLPPRVILWNLSFWALYCLYSDFRAVPLHFVQEVGGYAKRGTGRFMRKFQKLWHFWLQSPHSFRKKPTVYWASFHKSAWIIWNHQESSQVLINSND